MRTHLFALLLLAASLPAWAAEPAVTANPAPETPRNQADAPNTDIRFVKNRSGAVFYLMLGNSTLDLGDLNSRLTANGYPEAGKNHVMFGLGGHAVMDDWIVGGEFQVLSPKRVEGAGNSIRTTGSYLLANAGYVVKRTDSYMLYPQLGVGLGTFTMNIQSSGSATFDQIMANPNRGVQLTRNSLILNFGFAADGFRPVGETDSQTAVPFVFGFRAGYLLGIPMGDWQTSDGAASGGPSTAFTGPYLQVIIGAGFFNG